MIKDQQLGKNNASPLRRQPFLFNRSFPWFFAGLFGSCGLSGRLMSCPAVQHLTFLWWGDAAPARELGGECLHACTHLTYQCLRNSLVGNVTGSFNFLHWLWAYEEGNCSFSQDNYKVKGVRAQCIERNLRKKTSKMPRKINNNQEHVSKSKSYNFSSVQR